MITGDRDLSRAFCGHLALDLGEVIRKRLLLLAPFERRIRRDHCSAIKMPACFVQRTNGDNVHIREEGCFRCVIKRQHDIAEAAFVRVYDHWKDSGHGTDFTVQGKLANDYVIIC